MSARKGMLAFSADIKTFLCSRSLWDAPWRDETSGGFQVLFLRQEDKRRAETVSVLCGKYSSTLRRVLFDTPHGAAAFRARSCASSLVAILWSGGLRSVKTFVLFPLLLLGVSFSWHLALHRRWNKNKKRGAPGCGVPFFCNKYSLKEFGFDLFCGQQLVSQFLHGRDVGLLHAAFDGDGVLHDLHVFHVRQHARHDPSGRRCP